MAIRVISTLAELQVLTRQPKLTVVDFFATWCGPCKVIAPLLENLASRKQHVNFAKVDVDRTPDVIRDYPVRAMPTFYFFRDGNVVATFEGADINSVTQLVQQHEVIPPPAIPSDKELDAMKPRDLLSLMRQHHISTTGLMEKSELIEEIRKYRR
ncbi:Thioredoxin/Thioredoxin-like [Leishmania donovani]|uniref:Thioredoxin/Thioredoxin-like_-_putative n=2 Tax=Leishmania donovani species complex TaxID=38574 RepID=A0A6L0XFG7_LEIIN|nr:Thioredoxin/Thioredoxin-like, putative [Leishmania donovani]CAC9493761.1 Thioredoxin/Thioredoxin-like_-_putative [Leishmania infantum]TPP40690.1 Thioredoxin family protein [Leishmania donovani]TPP48958.1 Thioredoxin family protein [Leishmania donovani]CAJ1989396.1 Thioredoxin/Thioredoxin-like [Leishmania donovani]